MLAWILLNLATMSNTFGSFSYGEAAYSQDLIRVAWPAPHSQRFASVWRVLDLSGMTNSVRESRNFTRAGFAFLNGRKVRSLKDTVELGSIFTLELRFPNGVTKLAKVFLFPATRHTVKTSRVTTPEPFKVNYSP
jgi:hypothetical protein